MRHPSIAMDVFLALPAMDLVEVLPKDLLNSYHIYVQVVKNDLLLVMVVHQVLFVDLDFDLVLADLYLQVVIINIHFVQLYFIIKIYLACLELVLVVNL